MATPAPKPDWMSQQDYDNYIIQLNFDENLGSSFFQNKQAEQQRLDDRGVQTQQLAPTPVDDMGLPSLQIEADPVPQPLNLTFPGQFQFETGTGMYRRLIPSSVDKAQVDEFEAIAADLIDAGYPSEAQVMQETEQWLADNGYQIFARDPDEQRAYQDMKAELLRDTEWAEKIAYQDIFGEETSPRRPRAASEFDVPAPSIGSSELTKKTPEEIAEMGTFEVMYEAAKPQVLETPAAREQRKVREGYLQSLENEGAKYAEENNVDIDSGREVVYNKFFQDKQTQARNQAYQSFTTYTGNPVEQSTSEEVDQLAREIYLQFLNNNFPEEYRLETRRTSDQAAFGIESDKQGMFFTVWGDAIHRGFLTNEVDVTGLRTAMYDVGILEEPDLITETMAGALVRDIGGIVRVPINPVKEMLTYSVNPYDGTPLDPNDWGLIAVEEMGRKEDAAWGKTILLPEGTGIIEDYFKTTAYEIATMRTLGDDLASMSMVPEDYETAVRIGGLAAELLIPISPKSWLAPIGAVAGATAVQTQKAVKGATKAQLSSKAKQVATLRAEQTQLYRLADEASDAADFVRSGELSNEGIAIGADISKLETELYKAEAAAAKIDLRTAQQKAILGSPIKSYLNRTTRRAHLETPLRAAEKDAGLYVGLSDQALYAAKAEDIIGSENFAQRYAEEVGRWMEDLVDLAVGSKSEGAAGLERLGMSQDDAVAFINALAKENKTIAGRLGNAAKVEINQFEQFLARADEFKQTKETGAFDVPASIEDRLERFRLQQALSDTQNPYRTMAKEELLNTMFSEYVPLTSRVIVSQGAMKKYWPKMKEKIAQSRAMYLTETGNLEKPYELTVDGVAYIEAQLGRSKRGPLWALMKEATENGSVALTPEQAVVISEKLAEAVAVDVLGGTSQMLRPKTATPQVQRAFIPESQRLFSQTVFEGTSVAAKKFYSVMKENVSIPLMEKITGPKPKGMSPPMWANSAAKGIEDGIAALDNGMLEAFNGARRALAKQGFKEGEEMAEAVFQSIFTYSARGGDPMDFITDAERIIARQAATAGAPKGVNARGENNVLKGMFLVLRNHIGSAAIKTDTDLNIFIERFRQHFNVSPKVSDVKMREMGRRVPKEFLVSDLNLNTSLTPREIMDANRIQGFLDSLPPGMKQEQVINPAAVESLGIVGKEQSNIEISMVQFIFGRARDKVVERVINKEVLRGDTGFLNRGRYNNLELTVMNRELHIVDNNTEHILYHAVPEQARVASAGNATIEAPRASRVIIDEINQFNLTPAGRTARAEFIAAVTRNVMKYGDYTRDEQLFQAFDNYMNQVRVAPGQPYLMDKIRDNAQAMIRADQDAYYAAKMKIGTEGLAEIEADIARFHKEIKDAKAYYNDSAEVTKYNEWKAARERYDRQYSEWEARKAEEVSLSPDNFDESFDRYFGYDDINPPPTKPAILDEVGIGGMEKPDFEGIVARGVREGDVESFGGLPKPPAQEIRPGVYDNPYRGDFPDDFKISPTDIFRNKQMSYASDSGTTPQLFDEMVYELVYNQPQSIAANLQTRGIAAGYMTDMEFADEIQAVLMTLGKEEYAVMDKATKQMLDQLSNDFATLALQGNRSGFSANFYEIRRKNPFFWGAVMADVKALTQGFRRNIISGQLAGKYIPNFPYQSENVLTAPLIGSVTSPDYLSTIIAQQFKIGGGVIAESAQAILRRMGMGDTKIKNFKMTPQRVIQNQIANGAGSEVWFTTVTGEKITYNRAQQLLLEHNTGRSQQALQLGETLVNDIKFAARRASMNRPQGLSRTGAGFWQELINSALTGRTPSYAHWANGADQAMREATFFRALEAGVEPRMAAGVAREVVLDYGSVPVWMRKQLGGLFLYTSFMYKMSAATLSSVFRGARQTQQLTEGALGASQRFLSGTPVQNLVRAAAWKRAWHNSMGQWMFTGDMNKSTMWSYYLGEMDNTDAYMVGVRDPVISQVIMFGDFMDYAYAVTGAAGLTDAYVDKPIGTRTVEGLLDTLYSPTISILTDIKDAKSGQRVPAKFVQMWKYVGAFDSIMTFCDIEVVRDPAKQRAGEPLYEGSVQYKFRSQEGVNNYMMLNYMMQIAGAQRMGQDITATLIAMGAVPDGTQFFRYNADELPPAGLDLMPGDALRDGAGYLIIRNRPVRLPKEWEAYDRVLMKNKAKLELKGKRGR